MKTTIGMMLEVCADSRRLSWLHGHYPTFSIDSTELRSVKLCQTMEIWVTMRLSTPRRVYSQAYPKNSGPSKESSQHNFSLCQCRYSHPKDEWTFSVVCIIIKNVKNCSQKFLRGGFRPKELH